MRGEVEANGLEEKRHKKYATAPSSLKGIVIFFFRKVPVISEQFALATDIPEKQFALATDIQKSWCCFTVLSAMDITISVGTDVSMVEDAKLMLPRKLTGLL